MTQRIRIVDIKTDGIGIEQIESIKFGAIYVGGLPVPNERTIQLIIGTLPDIESRILFSLASNDWVSIHSSIYKPEYYTEVPYPRLMEQVKQRLKLIEIDRRVALTLGFDFDKLHYSRALISWYEFVKGNRISDNPQKLRRALSRVETVRKGGASLSSVRIPHKEFPHLLDFDEYSQAKSYTESFIKVFKNSVGDEDIEQLIIESYPIHTSLMTSAEKHPLNILRSFCCPQCGKYQLIRGFNKTPKDCGSPKCKQAYSANTTKKSREQPHALIKKRASEFLKIDNTRRVCQGDDCGKRRILNNQNRCKPCHIKGL